MIHKYETSPVHIKWRNDEKLLKAMEKMPDIFWKKFEFENGKYFVLISFEKQEGFAEMKKSEIKEPNKNFCDLIKNLFI